MANQPAPAPQLPPQLRAVMPSFMYRSTGGGAGTGAGTGLGGYAPHMNQYGLPDEQNSNYNSSGQSHFKQRQSGAGGSGSQHGPDEYAPQNRGGDRRMGDRYDRHNRRGPPPNRSNRHDYSYNDIETPAQFSGKHFRQLEQK